MQCKSFEPNTALPAIRHDGWTGEAIAKLLETLAETGIVLEACDAAHKSSTAAYALRRRDPLFAQPEKRSLEKLATPSTSSTSPRAKSYCVGAGCFADAVQEELPCIRRDFPISVTEPERSRRVSVNPGEINERGMP